MSAARRGSLTLICVTLNDKTDWEDHMALYDYGFSKLRGYYSGDSSFCLKVPCVGGEQATTAVIGAEDVSLVLKGAAADEVKRTVFLDPFVYAPVRAGEQLGRIDYTLDGETLKSVSLVAAEDVQEKPFKKNIFQKIKEFFTYG